jgi:hypothetical protein
MSAQRERLPSRRTAGAKQAPPTFVITLEATRRESAIRDLRAFLKLAWRRYGLRACELREGSS